MGSPGIIRAPVRGASPPTATRAAIRAGTAFAVVLSAALVAVVPRAAGMSWSHMMSTLGGVSSGTLAALASLWVLELWAHTYVTTAALPGLNRGRALLLNLSGTAVSNVVPFGGPAGIGVNYAMARSWGVAPGSFASFAAISHVWNVFGKLIVGSALVAGAIAAGIQLSPGLTSALVWGSAGMLALTTGAVVALSTPAFGDAFGRASDSLLNHLLVRAGSSRRVHTEAVIGRLRATCGRTVAAGWRRLTAWMLVHMGLQAVLLAASLSAVGVHASPLVIAAAFGIERILSLFPFTPGGAGVAELGTVAILVNLGGDPTMMAAGVLLYRTFIYFLTIPVGAASVAIAFLLPARPIPAISAMARDSSAAPSAYEQPNSLS